MANQHRGEVEAELDGMPHTLCLTLGALAELETCFGDTDMVALAERFQSGRLSARDVTRIIGAGLRGGGHAIDDLTVAQMRAPDGAIGFVKLVAKLLAATFGAPAIGAAVGSAVEAAIDEAANPQRTVIADPPPVRGSAAEHDYNPFPGTQP